jgi:hemoglobin/transferrin/lactoferrin receptor protein
VLFDFYAQDMSNQADTNYDIDWSGSLRARLGYSAGRLLLFGTGGLAFLRESQTRTQHIDSAPAGALNASRRFTANSTPFFSETDSKLRTGWTLGGGAEFALGNNWSVRGDYGYSRFGRSEFRFDDARAGVGQTFTVAGAYLRDPVTNALLRDPVTGAFLREMTTYSGTSDVVTGRRARNSMEAHQLRIGVNYRF